MHPKRRVSSGLRTPFHPGAAACGGPAATRRPAGRGVSLVEVLVVLVILLIGMLTIARLFPGGFFSINHSASVTLATALAKRNEDYLLNLRENIPDGVVGIDPRTGLVRSDITPDDLLSSQPYLDNPIANYSGTPPDDPRHSGVNQVRRVLGEHFKIPPPVLGYGPSGETVSLHRSLFSPIYSADPMPGSALGVVAYSATPLQRVVFEGFPTPRNIEDLFRLGAFGYGIDYEGAALYFVSVDYDRRYKVEYTFRLQPDQAGQSIPDNCAFAPAGPAPQTDPNSGSPVQFSVQRFNLRTGTVDAVLSYDALTRQFAVQAGPGTSPPPDCVFVPLQTGQLDPGSDLVYRRFQRLALNQRFSPDPANSRTVLDPYEFKVYDPVFGLFGFHPVAASVPVPRQQGRGIQARIDYDVDDWHILRQDEVVPTDFADPTAATLDRVHAIRLSTGPIKQIGEMEDEINFTAASAGGGQVDTTFQYQGLVRLYPAYNRGGLAAPARPGTANVDVMIVDLQTGHVIDSRSLQNPNFTALPGTNNFNGEIDYNAGIIHLREFVTFRLPDNLGGTVLSPPVRVAGRHLRVYYRSANDFAVATFKPYSNYFLQPDLTRLQHREYYPGYGAGYLLFNTTDAEKSVAVDYTWLNRNTGALHTETGELHRLEAPGTSFAPTPGFGGVSGFNPAGRWWLRLTHADPDPSKGPQDSSADPDVTPGTIQIRGVRGASFHTRVVWREAGRLRYRERTTVLNRAQSR